MFRLVLVLGVGSKVRFGLGFEVVEWWDLGWTRSRGKRDDTGEKMEDQTFWDFEEELEIYFNDSI